MKKTILFLILLFTLSANAQWKTIYEGGFGTSVALRYDCGSGFFFHSDASQTTINFSVSDDQNRIGMHAYMSPFSTQSELTAGIHKYLPEMAQYASLRVYLDMDLPDSVGTVHYSKLMDTTFKDPNTGAPQWTDFETGITSSVIYFTNFEGAKTIYIYTDLNISPASIYYDYLRIEADTTQLLNSPGNTQADFDIFSSGNELYIQPNQTDSDYGLQLFDLSGTCVYQEQKSGPQNLPMNFSEGIYLVVVTQNGTSYQAKVYVE
ncbi:MAG: hypothetical protein K0S23_2345 [Fluviicola sp.]|jgi:hypothetical protein|uniref:T9SS type A sorting domain-containing protein n=1 Tax=Fluviicola sp. TaxID=1917219 RepID=UPI00262C3908|nr:T9SS type A sorting domain-containing protein [Fluviicola sp.]MDF3028038.1 hypothetical protein [Fluviicola sp.]